MRSFYRQFVIGAVSLAVALGCVSMQSAYSAEEKAKEAPAKKVSLADLPAPARTTIEALLMGGVIRALDRAEEGGKVIYDLEATIGELEVEYDVLENGVVISAGMAVPYASMPKAVRAAAEKYFGSAKGLKAFREGEEGKVFFEVEGKKGDAGAAIKLTDKGQIVEEEKVGGEAAKDEGKEKKAAKEQKVEKKRKARGEGKNGDGNGNGNGGKEGKARKGERGETKAGKEKRGEKMKAAAGEDDDDEDEDEDEDEDKDAGDDEDDDEDEDDDDEEKPGKNK